MLFARDKQLESKLLEYVVGHPEASVSEIAHNLSMEPQIARLYIARLLKEGLLLGSLGHERPHPKIRISEGEAPEMISTVEPTAPQEPYMSFVVHKMDKFEDKVLLSDKTGNNSLSLGWKNPLLGRIKQGIRLDVYEDRIDVK